MRSLLEIMPGSQLILGLVLVGVLLVAVRLLFAADLSPRHKATQDRRQKKESPTLPFYDSTQSLVTEDRRKLPDRRKRKVYFSVDENGSRVM